MKFGEVVDDHWIGVQERDHAMSQYWNRMYSPVLWPPLQGLSVSPWAGPHPATVPAALQEDELAVKADFHEMYAERR